MHISDKSKKLVAVVVPLSNKKEFTADEELSFRHLMRFLAKYDKFLIVPEGLQISRPGFYNERFDKRYFGSLAAHNKLMLSPQFYERFSNYKFILVHHLDALIFSDQLTQWCERGFDYIGAPWVKFDGAPYSGAPGNENKVGNGGFSLRKIESFLKVIYSPKYCAEPSAYWERNYGSKAKYKQLMYLPKKFLKHLRLFNGARREMSRYVYNEEHFWANRAEHYYPEFNIAPLETALHFAFECGPRICYEKTNRTLPFGCHAWQKYDREFWEPYLLT